VNRWLCTSQTIEKLPLLTILTNMCNTHLYDKSGGGESCPQKIEGILWNFQRIPLKFWGILWNFHRRLCDTSFSLVTPKEFCGIPKEFFASGTYFFWSQYEILLKNNQFLWVKHISLVAKRPVDFCQPLFLLFWCL
jgi:hypothetical protein